MKNVNNFNEVSRKFISTRFALPVRYPRCTIAHRTRTATMTERSARVLKAQSDFLCLQKRVRIIPRHTQGRKSLLSIRKLRVTRRDVVKVTGTVCISFKRCPFSNDKAPVLSAGVLASCFPSDLLSIFYFRYGDLATSSQNPFP